MTRDSQRGKLYKAEFSCRWYKAGGRMETVEECQAFVDRVVASDWLHRAFTTTADWCKIVVLDGRGRRSACADTIGNRISMPAWSRSRAIVLHELAHHIVDDTYRRRVYRLRPPGPDNPFEPPAAHGWQFAACQLALVRHFIGAAEHDELREAFRRHKVRYKAPRVLSPEQRAAAAARFAAMRAGAAAAREPQPAETITGDDRALLAALAEPEPIHIPDCPR